MVWDSWSIYYVILGSILTILLLKKLFQHKKYDQLFYEVKARALMVFGAILSILNIYFLYLSVRDYNKWNTAYYLHRSYTYVFWILIFILIILYSKDYFKITDKGIYIYGYFADWSKVKSYKWIYDNEIKIDIIFLGKFLIHRKINIEEEKRKEIDILLEKNMFDKI